MKKTLWPVLVLLALSSPGPARERPAGAAFAVSNAAVRIDARVQEYVRAGLFSGVVLVTRGDAVVYERAVGLRGHGQQRPHGDHGHRAIHPVERRKLVLRHDHDHE